MTYRKKFWLWAAAAFGSAMLLGVVIGKTVPSSGGVADPVLVLPILLLGVCALVIPVWVWWQKTDDIQQQGQMISWWWGGNFGALAMIVILVVMTGRHSEMSSGAIYLFLAEFAGFALVWCAWKLRGRGPAE